MGASTTCVRVPSARHTLKDTPRTGENNSHEPAGQRRTTNCVVDLGEAILESNAQPEEPRRVKKIQRSVKTRVDAHQFSGWSPASPRVGRPRKGPHNTRDKTLASACPAREALKDTLENHPATVRGGGS